MFSGVLGPTFQAMTNPHLDSLLRLPVGERLEAIEELWESLGGEAELFPLSEEERAELDRRIADDEADGDQPGLGWPEVRRRIEQGDA